LFTGSTEAEAEESFARSDPGRRPDRSARDRDHRLSCGLARSTWDEAAALTGRGGGAPSD